ncbi:MerR family transcriptional regulator [Ktedonosporobacter rubrisoli]|uniref:MerR family transcriptional regulator n=1 Tax=Ktedonosporobacter rubrisoli TaxID=2509675 RepID=A0A4P6JQF6_KTERU|nr:MerR family transcriptional regulator [Ktedonosporobacter rubrisoli]QBD76996.1 MerR family transcriptional regulator [Ktedonosporobacter rubrisoli]
MHIGQLATLTGVSERSLRHYEYKGLIYSKRLENGYRDFEESQIERVKAVQFYLGLGLNTVHIGHILNCNPDDAPRIAKFCPQLLDLYENKLAEVNRDLEYLLELKTRLETNIANFKAAKKILQSRAEPAGHQR